MSKFQYHKDMSLPNTRDVVFVFGSNTAGIHGAGSAKVAVMKFGARYGRGIGISGMSYGIPTKDKDFTVLPLDTIATYVDRFAKFTNKVPQIKFFVTAIGTGLAGYRDIDIAPMFKHCSSNCSFPDQWKPFLED